MNARLLSVLLLAPLLAAASLPSAVEKSLRASSSSESIALLDAALASAAPSDAPWVLLYLAEAHRAAGDTTKARSLFERLLAEHPTSGAKDPATLGIAVINAGGEANGNTLATLELIGDADMPASLEVDRWLLVADARARELSAGPRVKDALDRAARAAKGNTTLTRRVEAVRTTATPAPTPVSTARATDAAPLGDDTAAIRALRTAVAAQDWDKAAALAAAFTADHPSSPLAMEAAYAARRAEARVPTDPSRVAVLLPLTGNLALAGGNLKAAIELGVQRSGGRVVLDVFDTAGQGGTCVSRLEEAVIKHGASLVIGPLHKDEAAACAPVAQALRVPLVTLTSSEEALSVGDHVFRAFPSVEQQVEALLTEVMDVRRMTRFAVMHPTNAYSEGAARVFTQAVGARGGTVVYTQTYDPEAKDFRAPAKALGRKDYKARSAEFAQLKRIAERDGGDPDKVVLPPLIDYEAIFVPDTYQRTALVAAALAFEEFPVGKFRPRKEDRPLPLLGLNAWNNDDFPRRGGMYVQDSIFVDAYDAHADTGAANDFRSDWRALGKGEPSVIVAVGYDVGRLAAAAVAAGGGIDGLRSARLETPVAGTHGFLDTRQADRSWTLLTVTKEGVGLLQPPAPPTPPETPPQ